ncbi:hypothetical protein Ancab_007726 [Ancistrocladus abbreviatus]
MQMDILFPVGRKAFLSVWSTATNPFHAHASSFPYTYCSRKSSQLPQRNGDNSDGSNQNGDKFSRDWDKAWSNFRKQGRKTTSKISPSKYVSWNPRPSNYPPSEEIDPIKRTERSNLMLWTSQTFTLAVAVAIVTLLLIYTLLAPMK